jgi:hypothetical protein
MFIVAGMSIAVGMLIVMGTFIVMGIFIVMGMLRVRTNRAFGSEYPPPPGSTPLSGLQFAAGQVHHRINTTICALMM